MKPITIKLPPELYQKVESAAGENEENISLTVRILLREALKYREQKREAGNGK